jgi:hypothetical protein
VEGEQRQRQVAYKPRAPRPRAASRAEPRRSAAAPRPPTAPQQAARRATRLPPISKQGAREALWRGAGGARRALRTACALSVIATSRTAASRARSVASGGGGARPSSSRARRSTNAYACVAFCFRASHTGSALPCQARTRYNSPACDSSGSGCSFARSAQRQHTRAYAAPAATLALRAGCSQRSSARKRDSAAAQAEKPAAAECAVSPGDNRGASACSSQACGKRAAAAAAARAAAPPPDSTLASSKARRPVASARALAAARRASASCRRSLPTSVPTGRGVLREGGGGDTASAAAAAKSSAGGGPVRRRVGGEDEGVPSASGCTRLHCLTGEARLNSSASRVEALAWCSRSTDFLSSTSLSTRMPAAERGGIPPAVPLRKCFDGVPSLAPSEQ